MRLAALLPEVLCLLWLGGCRHSPVHSPAVLERLSHAPGSHLAGPVAGLERQAVLDNSDFVYAIALSPDGTRAAFTHLGVKGFDLSIWALAPKRPVKVARVLLNAQAHDVESVDFSPDGQMLVTAGRDGALRFFDAASGRALGVHVAAEPLVVARFHPSGDLVVAGGAKGLVVTVRPSLLSAHSEARLHGDEVRGIAFDASGAVYTAGWDKALVRSTLEAPSVTTAGAPSVPALQPAGRWTFPHHLNDLTSDAAGLRLGVAFSREPARRTADIYRQEKRGEMPPQDAGNFAAIVDARTGAVLSRVEGHRGIVSTAAVSPDGASLASGGWDRKVLVHGGTNGFASPLAADTFGWSVRKVRFSLDGRHLLVAAWTPQNPLGNGESDPSAVVYLVRYSQPEVRGR